MSWHVANWIGLVLVLAALALGMGGALFIASRPHDVLVKVSDELGLAPEQSKDYRVVVEELRARQTVVAEADARIAAAEAKAARAEEETRSARVRAAELANRLANPVDAAPGPAISLLDRPLPTAQSAAPAAASTAQPASAVRTAAVAPSAAAAGAATGCGAGGAPLRCTLRFEPGSSGLDSTDRRQIELLVHGIRAAGWRSGVVSVVGMADRPGPSWGLQQVACSDPELGRDAAIACDRARSVLEEVQGALRGFSGFAFATPTAQLATTPGPSPSYRRADIVVRPGG